MLLAVVLLSLGIAACEKDSGEPRSYLRDTKKEQQEQAYIATMQQAIAVVDNPQTFPIEEAIRTANHKELINVVDRWDRATQIAASAKPPADAQGIHTDLVASMRELGKWNRKIAAAAPKGPKATQKVAKQAQASDASKMYGAALGALLELGYNFQDPAVAEGGGGAPPEGGAPPDAGAPPAGP
jgi:hypothetical protein